MNAIEQAADHLSRAIAFIRSEAESLSDSNRRRRLQVAMRVARDVELLIAPRDDDAVSDERRISNPMFLDKSDQLS